MNYKRKSIISTVICLLFVCIFIFSGCSSQFDKIAVCDIAVNYQAFSKSDFDEKICQVTNIKNKSDFIVTMNLTLDFYGIKKLYNTTILSNDAGLAIKSTRFFKDGNMWVEIYCKDGLVYFDGGNEKTKYNKNDVDLSTLLLFDSGVFDVESILQIILNNTDFIVKKDTEKNMFKLNFENDVVSNSNYTLKDIEIFANFDDVQNLTQMKMTAHIPMAEVNRIDLSELGEHDILMPDACADFCITISEYNDGISFPNFSNFK